MVKFLSEYWYIWGAVLIILGLFIAFFGNVFVKIIIFIVVTCVVWGLGSWLVFGVLESKDKSVSTAIQWTIVSCMLVLGLIIGALFAWCKRFGIALLGCAGGVILGLFIVTVTTIANEAAYISIIVACGIVCGLITYWLEPYIIMFSTSFIGAYAFIRGISVYAGKFPSEVDLFRMLKNHTITRKDVDPVWYAYAAAILVVFIVALVIQCCRHKRKIQREEDEKRGKYNEIGYDHGRYGDNSINDHDDIIRARKANKLL